MTMYCVRGIPLAIAGNLLRVTLAVALLTAFAAATRAEDPSPLKRIEALHLDTVKIGRVTAHFVPTDREYAHELATLSEAAAAYFERELDGSFPLQLAILSREHWFDPHWGGDSLPYGIPWGSVEDLLMTVPASLDEGVLILGPDDKANRRRVRFVMLHEFGHIANKRHLHPESPIPYSSVRWFEELLATYFAYSYVRADDPEWAEASRREWVDFLNGYSPAVLSLDWGFMRELAPDEIARTYAWYQILLNLWVANLYEERGLDFLRAVKDRLPWKDSGTWTTESLVPALEEIAPGFEARAVNLERGEYLQDLRVIDEQH